jgi:nucleoside-diphosphate-sugar epimerase
VTRGPGAPQREVTIVGAASRIGRALAIHLTARDWRVVGIARRGAAEHHTTILHRTADFTDALALRDALVDARRIVVCAPVKFVPGILDSLPEGVELVVILGSARKYTRFPDRAAEHVRRAEEAFARARLPGVMLHPTMIYGASGENNVQRLAAMLRRIPVVPLPAAGRSLVQPIHVDDVVACLAAALERDLLQRREIVIAGPAAITYREMVRAVGDAVGVRVLILPVPRRLAALLAAAGQALLRTPAIRSDEIRRLAEDKAHDIGDMTSILGITPIDFRAGLARTFRAGATAPPAYPVSGGR